MKLKLLLPTLLLVCNFAFAQHGKMREKIKAQKIAFITDQLDLTSEEAQSFWPIFNEYESNTEKIKNGELRDIRRSFRMTEDLSTEEANNLLDRLVSAEVDLHELRLELVQDLKSILPPQKILKLKAVDEEFNRKLLERLREMRQKRKDGKSP